MDRLWRMWLRPWRLTPDLQGGGFDAGYDVAHNPDIVAAGFDPLTHHRVHGWKERCDPSAHFGTAGHLEANPDAAAMGIDPLLHFWLHGFAEGRVGWQKASAREPDTRRGARNRHHSDFVEIRQRLRTIEEAVLWR